MNRTKQQDPTEPRPLSDQEWNNYFLELAMQDEENYPDQEEKDEQQ